MRKYKIRGRKCEVLLALTKLSQDRVVTKTYAVPSKPFQLYVSLRLKT